MALVGPLPPLTSENHQVMIRSQFPHARTALLLAASLGLAACGGQAGAAPAAPTGAVAGDGSDVMAFVNVNVVPMDREVVLERQTVLVRDGRIVAVRLAAQTTVPAGAQRIDGSGKFLMPGLAEMHAHIPGPQNPAFQENVLFLYVSNGVTTARGMLGHPSHLQLRERAARGDLISPTIITSGPSVNGNSAPTPEAAERMVREQKEAGYDFVKLHPGLSRPVFDRMAATAREVGLPFAGHVSEEVGLARTLEARQATVDHLDGYMEMLVREGAATQGVSSGFFGMNLTPFVDPARLRVLARATREAGVWNVPTQSLIENLASPEDPEAMARRPGMQYMPPQMVQGWITAKRNLQADAGFDPARAQRFIEVRRQLIRALHDEGAGLLLGSDAPQIFNVPGFAIHPELRMLVASGLTPYEALVTGTRNPAAFFGTPEDFGTVQVGRRADLILLDANPLQDIANVQRRAGVMVRGRWLPESEIQQRLQAIAAAVRAPTS
jgi:imidazolonepropionase-like amidohydrolase